jgi:tetratricopeptide (TPR) repeat protein
MRTLPLLAAAAVLAAAPAFAQDWKGMGRVEGKVLDSDGKPIVGASVKLDLPSRGGGTTVKSDKKGRWAVGGIAAGNWNLDVEAAGYAPKKASFQLASESQRLGGIDIVLEASGPKGPPPEVLEALKKADDAYKGQRFEEAIAEYNKLLALRPDLAVTIHQQIGFSLIQLKKYGEALDHLQKVVDAEPANQRMKAIMAQAAVEGGLMDRALPLLSSLDDAAIASPDVYFNIGVGFLNANKPEEAITYFTKAIAKDPAYADGYFRRGLAALQLGRMAEAKTDLQKLLELQPTGPQADLAKKALESLK